MANLLLLLADVDSEPAIVTDGLVADWQFDEGSGTNIADHVGAADLTITGGAATWVTAGCQMDDPVYAQNAASPSVSQPVTHVICAKFDPVGVNSFYVSDGGGAAGRQIFADSNNALQDHFLFFYAGANQTSWTADDFPTGVWAILFVEFNGAASKIYNQLVLKFTADAGAGGLVGSTLNARYTGTVNMTSGTWGRRLIYSKVLSEEEKTQVITALKYFIAQRGVVIA